MARGGPYKWWLYVTSNLLPIMEALSTFISLRWHWVAVIKRLHKRVMTVCKFCTQILSIRQLKFQTVITLSPSPYHLRYAKKLALWHVGKVPFRKSRPTLCRLHCWSQPSKLVSKLAGLIHFISSDTICGHIRCSKIFLKTSIKNWHMISTLTSLHTSYSPL